MKEWKNKIARALGDGCFRNRLKENLQVGFVAIVWITLTLGLFAYDAAHPKSPQVHAPAKATGFHQAKFQ